MLPPLETWAERPLTSGELMRSSIAHADATLSLRPYGLFFPVACSLSVSSSHQPEKVGLVTASIISVSESATDCGSRVLANDQGAYLVLNAHAPGVTRPREALLRLSISSM